MTTTRRARAADRTTPRGKPAPKAGVGTECYQLRRYRMRIGPQGKLIDDFLAEALFPALARAGAGPLGAFEPIGGEIPARHALLTYPSLAAMGEISDRAGADPALGGAAARAYLQAPASATAYDRYESDLLGALSNLPRLEVPAGATKNTPRVFELRTYESPSEAAREKKIEMFTRLGETEIFRRVGLVPVFFGRTLVGGRQPSFTYLLVFPDLAAREAAWNAFRADPEWQKLRATPGYSDAELLTNITSTLLRPTAYSQI